MITQCFAALGFVVYRWLGITTYGQLQTAIL